MLLVKGEVEVEQNEVEKERVIAYWIELMVMIASIQRGVEVLLIDLLLLNRQKMMKKMALSSIAL